MTDKEGKDQVMSMRRKILCVLLVIMTALAVAACGGDNSQDSSQNAFEAFTEVQKNMEDIRDAEFKMSMDMTTDAAGEDDEVTMKMSGTGKEILKSKSDIEMEMNYNMTMPGLESGLKGTMYMQDQIVYMDMMGQKLINSPIALRSLCEVFRLWTIFWLFRQSLSGYGQEQNQKRSTAPSSVR